MLRLLHQLGAARLHAGISREIGRAAQRILDRAPRQVARLDHIVGGSGMIGFGITHHVHDVRLHGHLHIDAGGQMRAGRIDLQRIAQQAGARLPPDAKVRPRPTVR